MEAAFDGDEIIDDEALQGFDVILLGAAAETSGTVLQTSGPTNPSSHDKLSILNKDF